jgi:hypothetical protein
VINQNINTIYLYGNNYMPKRKEYTESELREMLDKKRAYNNKLNRQFYEKNRKRLAKESLERYHDKKMQQVSGSETV